MKRPTMGGVYLLGRDRDVWERPNPGDLITLKPDYGKDLLSSWLNAKFIGTYHQVLGRYFKVYMSFSCHHERQTSVTRPRLLLR